MNHYRRDPSEAYRLAAQLEPQGTLHLLYLDDGQVQSGFFPSIDYRKDSLPEISQKLRMRKKISDPITQ